MTFIYVLPKQEEDTNGYGIVENGVPHPENNQNDNQKKSNLCSRLMTRIKGKAANKHENLQNDKKQTEEKKSKFSCCSKNTDGTKNAGCFSCCRKRKSDSDEPQQGGCFSCCRSKKRKVDTDNSKKKSEEDIKPGCFSCCRKKNKSNIKVNIEKVKDNRSCWEKMNCCKRNKIGDRSSDKKDSWADRRESILSHAPRRKRTCKDILKCMFCCCCCKDKVGDDPLSRRISTNKSLTPIEIHEDLTPKIDISLVEHTSTMKGAIPVLPMCLAWFCCILNVFLPGIGTALSGMFCLCMGKARFSQRDGAKQRVGSFIINLIIGFGQLFTVLFCLVGWGWSIWWGVIMIKMAKRQRKLKRIEDAEKAEEARQNQIAAQANARAAKDIERGRVS